MPLGICLALSVTFLKLFSISSFLCLNFSLTTELGTQVPFFFLVELCSRQGKNVPLYSFPTPPRASDGCELPWYSQL